MDRAADRHLVVYGRKPVLEVLAAAELTVAKVFVSQLDDEELALLERALNKVIVDCSFG